MNDAERLKLVKTAMGISGHYQDNLLGVYIEDAKNTLINAGVSKEIAESKEAIGAIVRYVVDTWSYEAGRLICRPCLLRRLSSYGRRGAASKWADHRRRPA